MSDDDTAEALALSDSDTDNPKRSRRNYTDEDKIIALLELDANGGNVYRTAHARDIPYATLARWDGDRKSGRLQSSIVGNIQGQREKRGNLTQKMESLLHSLIESMAAKIPTATLSQTAVAYGIVTDKLRQMRTHQEADPAIELARILNCSPKQLPATLALEPGETIPDGLGPIIETVPLPDNPDSFEAQSFQEPNPKTHAPDCLGFTDITDSIFKNCSCGLIKPDEPDDEGSIN